MSSTIKIQSDFPSALEKQLLERVCRERGHRHVYVAQFSRFGFSGARLLLVYFGHVAASLPFLLKIAGFVKAQQEYKATRLLEPDVRDARFAVNRVFHVSYSGKKWGALLYDHRGTDSSAEAANPRALRQIIYNPQSSPTKLRTILREVFMQLRNAHSRNNLERVPIRSHFERYFRKHNARARIHCILGPHADSNRLDFLGAKIVNPLKYLEALPKSATLCVGPVHGDLHPDNIIIDRMGSPHLIDFAWAHKSRDILVDFVLLENSIRFMAFPRPINLRDQLRVDRALVHENGFNQVMSESFYGPERRDAYARLACAVEVIREAARAALGQNFSMQRYLLVQLILLYGLLRYEQYEPYVSTRALGLIAAQLQKIGLPS